MGLLYDFGDMKKLVKTYVVDDERKDAALDVVKEFKARGKAENKDGRRGYDLSRRYHNFL